MVPGDFAHSHTGKGLSPDPSLCWWNTQEEQVGGRHEVSHTFRVLMRPGGFCPHPLQKRAMAQNRTQLPSRMRSLVTGYAQLHCGPLAPLLSVLSFWWLGPMQPVPLAALPSPAQVLTRPGPLSFQDQRASGAVREGWPQTALPSLRKYYVV